MALNERDVSEIRSLVDRDTEAVRRSDWAAVVEMFTDDAIRFPPHRAPIRGREAIRAWLETFPPVVDVAITADEIVGCGDLAFDGADVLSSSDAPRRPCWRCATPRRLSAARNSR